MKSTWKDINTKIKDFLTWKWVESLFHWILTSGGTISGLIFLSAGVWLSIVKSVPDFIHKYMDTNLADLLTYLSRTAFTGLPEIILFLATVKTLEQIKLARVLDKETIAHKMAITWSWLFGIPSVIFISFALINIGLSLASSDYTMPDYIVIGRGLTCFIYALLIFIYESQGKDCFASQVKERDSKISELETRLTEKDEQFTVALAKKDREMQDALARKEQELLELREESFLQLTAKQNELDNSHLELSREKNEKLRLAERASSLASDKLSFYPKLRAFLEKERCKTLNVDSIVDLTGHPKRRINRAIAEKALSLQSRNKEVLVSSLLKWLQDSPLPSVVIQEENNGNGHSQTEEIETFSLPLLTVGYED
jgi:hypothetical protein